VGYQLQLHLELEDIFNGTLQDGKLRHLLIGFATRDNMLQGGQALVYPQAPSPLNQGVGRSSSRKLFGRNAVIGDGWSERRGGEAGGGRVAGGRFGLGEELAVGVGSVLCKEQAGHGRHRRFWKAALIYDGPL